MVMNIDVIKRSKVKRGKVKGHKRSRVKGQGHYKCKRKGRWAHANVKLLYLLDIWDLEGIRGDRGAVKVPSRGLMEFGSMKL